MKRDPELAEKFANVVLEELAALRGELISHRALLIELLSRTSKEPRRKIKDRLYGRRLRGPMSLARELKERAGLREKNPEKTDNYDA